MSSVNMTRHAENMMKAGLYMRTAARTIKMENEVNQTFIIKKLNKIFNLSKERAKPPNIFDDLLSVGQEEEVERS